VIQPARCQAYFQQEGPALYSRNTWLPFTPNKKRTQYIHGLSSVPFIPVRKDRKNQICSKVFTNYISLPESSITKEKSVLEVLSHETTRDLLMFIIEQRDPTHTVIINYMEISSSSVNCILHDLLSYK
jgi:hypothetical protein